MNTPQTPATETTDAARSSNSGNEGTTSTRRQRRIRIVAGALGVVLLAGALLATVLIYTHEAPTGSSSHAQTTAQPSATLTPRTLFQADLSGRTAAWTRTPGWRITNGALVNDGTGQMPLALPFIVTNTPYTITIIAQVNGVPPISENNRFGLLAQTATGAELYNAVADCQRATSPFYGFTDLEVYDPKAGLQFVSNDYIPGPNARQYSVQERNWAVGYSIGAYSGGVFFTNAPQTPAHLFLVDRYVRLTITSVTITTP